MRRRSTLARDLHDARNAHHARMRARLNAERAEARETLRAMLREDDLRSIAEDHAEAAAVDNWRGAND